jgi:uncharacterized metal-binding protein YceD (DUF177 family)
MEEMHIQSVNLSRLLREGGSTDARGEILERIALGNERIPLDGPARWRVSVTRVEGEGGQEFWLSGEIAGNAVLECRRCLTPTPTPVRAHFQYMLRYQPGLQHLEAHSTDAATRKSAVRDDAGSAPRNQRLEAHSTDAATRKSAVRDDAGSAPRNQRLEAHSTDAATRKSASAHGAGDLPRNQRLEAIEEDGEEILLFGHPDLELGPLLSEAFALELPYTALCKEDCKGLCPVCGANRNEMDCGHREEPQTKLSAELSRLLGDLKD